VPRVLVYNICTHAKEDSSNAIGRPTPAVISCHPTKATRAATAGGDCNVSVWDFGDTNKFKCGMEQLAVLKGHSGVVNAIDWYKGMKNENANEMAEYLASVGDDGWLIIWDVASKKQLKQKRFEKEELSDVLWVKSSETMILSSVWGSVFVICAFPDISVLQSIQLAKTFIQGIAFDMCCLLAIQSSNTCRILKRKTKKNGKTLDQLCFERKNMGLSLCHFPTNKYHMFAANVANLRRKPCYSPDGLYLCTSGGQIRIDGVTWSAVHLFHRSNLAKKVSSYVIKEDNRVLVCKFCPVIYPCHEKDFDQDSLNKKYGMTYKMRFAAITRSSLYVFETSTCHPLLYWRDRDARDFFDLDWTCDGRALFVTDSESYITAFQF